jgi:hypothetical protein
LFGSALDAALNNLLVPVQDKSPEDIFIETFTKAIINGVETYLPDCIDLTYASSDLDFDMLELTQEAEDELSNIKSKKSKWGLTGLSKEERVKFNLANWESLKVKGFLMIQAYMDKVLPLIENVMEVQIPISLSNGEDSITGFVDLVANIKGHGLVILDNKTSSMEYQEDSVLTSPQLSLYMHALQNKYNTRKAGYIVLRKQIKKNRVKVCNDCGHDGSSARHTTCPALINSKRCGGSWSETIRPEVDIQIIIDEIPNRTEDIVLDNYDMVTKAIKGGVFTRNLQSCKNIYGGPCPYFGLCYKNSMKDLQEVP